MPARGPVLATAVVAALLAPGAALADTSIGALAAPTPIRAWAGIAVLGVLDPATGPRAAARRRSPTVAPSMTTVRELELRGTTLAENVHFGLGSVGIAARIRCASSTSRIAAAAA
jgi:hypothetical protein